MALDVLICAVGDGRAHPEQLAKVLLRLMAGQWIKLPRVADSLSEVARMSPLLAWFIAETPATRRCLEQIHGSGKAAKTATAILKFQPPVEAPTLQQALLQLLETRIARAERWAAADGGD